MVSGIRRADPGAWEAIYEQLGERVFRLTLRLTGDEEIARELTHDTFVIVAERGDQYSGRGTLAPWVFRIAANVAKDWLRKVGRRRALNERAFGDHPAHYRAGDTELTLVIRRAVGDLPRGQREVLMLHEVDGYSHSEIAEMLDIAEGTSKARLSRARAQLRDRLRKEL